MPLTSVLAVLGLSRCRVWYCELCVFTTPTENTLTSFAITPACEAHLRCKCKSSDGGTYKVDHNKVIMGVPCAAATGAL